MLSYPGSQTAAGKAISRDRRQGLEYYERSARAGFQRAALELAELYAEGKVVPADRAASLKWLTHGMPRLSLQPQPAAARP